MIIRITVTKRHIWSIVHEGMNDHVGLTLPDIQPSHVDNIQRRKDTPEYCYKATEHLRPLANLSQLKSQIRLSNNSIFSLATTNLCLPWKLSDLARRVIPATSIHSIQLLEIIQVLSVEYLFERACTMSAGGYIFVTIAVELEVVVSMNNIVTSNSTTPNQSSWTSVNWWWDKIIFIS